MIITDWRPYVRGALRGFVSVELGNGLVLLDCKVFSGRDGLYCQLPDKPSLKDGELQRDRDGNVIYYPTVRPAKREIGDKFSSAVLKLLREKYPNALAVDNSGGGAWSRQAAGSPQQHRGRGRA